jgi:hypothetical protein
MLCYNEDQKHISRRTIACFDIAFEPGFGHGHQACFGIAILTSVMITYMPTLRGTKKQYTTILHCYVISDQRPLTL